ncbi:PIN domain-containing protein [Mycolicibacterium fallax]|uniref:PIN domain-containing protein n=1 Tax=Mycolicibacterium fallax TaxID=1793 RepID=UPI000A15BB88|nr:PIN domain-containing protein [Mycolicibacterium fallax]MCB0929873.1 PIN domain-containing protein [Mycobacterium sp.]BBY99447.1 hypothetical protein MFAL_29140 [Mycolicibacterium fallax]
MSGFRVVLDTCSLVPIAQADLLLTLAGRGLYHPLWSDAVIGELQYAILLANELMTPERVARRLDAMNNAFEDALVTGWEPLEDRITGMADDNDRHIVAAAIQGNAEAIVTDNVRDFPNQALEPWGLHAISTSDFLLDLLDLSQGAVIGALIEMSDKRKNPPLTVDQILDSLELCPSVAFVREVRAIIDNGS